MKLLFTIKTLNSVRGGAERVLCDTTSGLAARGHDVSVLSFDPSGGRAVYPLSDAVNRMPLGIGNITQPATFMETLRRIVAIRRTVRAEKPDCVIAFMHSSFIPAAFALIGTNVPLIASEHIVPVHYKNRVWEYLLLRLSRVLIRKITVLSNAVKNSYPKSMQHKMIAVPNAVTAAQALADPIGADLARKTILSVGRLSGQKDQATLIKAFAALANDYPDWDLRMLGDGELRKDLEMLIRNLQMEDRIALPGGTDNIAAEYQKAQIFVLPSLYESFGLATAEAMAHGLPVIGFADCPGTNELIQHQKNGLLVEPGNDRAAAMKDALITLIQSPDLRQELGQKGIKDVQPYHLDRVLDLWENIIREIGCGDRI